MSDRKLSYDLTKDQQTAIDLLLTSDIIEQVLLYGGARSGKTFLYVLALLTRGIIAPGSRHAIWRLRLSHLRASIWADTLPNVVKRCYPGLEIDYNKSDLIARLPAYGSEYWFGGLDDKERVDKVLGQEYATIYLNECSQIPYSSVTTALTRLAQVVKLGSHALEREAGAFFLRPKAYFDCNPPSKKHWTYKLFIEGVDPETGAKLSEDQVAIYGQMRLNPDGNRANLPPNYVDGTLARLPARKRKRFLDGDFSDETDNALWNYGIIQRIDEENVPELVRVVVAIDPATSNNPGSDETGIIAAGIDGLGRGYVLADASMKGSPEQWAQAAVSMYRRYQANTIVAEVNNGGDMVVSTLRTIDPLLPVKKVHASRGKAIRAEPVATAYELGHVFHAGDFEELEEQLCDFHLDFDRSTAGYSPDRLDALVWALTELMVLAPKAQLSFG